MTNKSFVNEVLQHMICFISLCVQLGIHNSTQSCNKQGFNTADPTITAHASVMVCLWWPLSLVLLKNQYKAKNVFLKMFRSNHRFQHVKHDSMYIWILSIHTVDFILCVCEGRDGALLTGSKYSYKLTQHELTQGNISE